MMGMQEKLQKFKFNYVEHETKASFLAKLLASPMVQIKQADNELLCTCCCCCCCCCGWLSLHVGCDGMVATQNRKLEALLEESLSKTDILAKEIDKMTASVCHGTFSCRCCSFQPS